MPVRRSYRVAGKATVLLAIGAICVTVLSAQVRMTKDAALASYFPGATIDRRTAFLTEQQVRSIEGAARVRVDSKVLTYYVATHDGKIAGTAFFETRTIRSMPATFIVVVEPDTTVRAVEILAFHEPEDYLPPEGWLAQFSGTSPEDDLFLKRGIRNIAGATLSAQALSDAVRRLLVSYVVCVARGGGI